MKKGLIIGGVFLLIVIVGIICFGVYKNALNKYSLPEEEPKEVVSHEAIFTAEDYPKVDASRGYHPLVDDIAADFMNVDKSTLNYEYTPGRTSEVYHNLIDGKADVIFTVEADPEDLEYAKKKGVELNVIPVTSAAFIFFVNTENSVNNLTTKQVRDIYSGKITNWKELGGDDARIIAYQRPKGSGSQTAMASIVMKDTKLADPPQTEIIREMGEVIDAVAEYDNAKDAIGYSYYYYVQTMYKKDTIKILSIDGIEPTNETIKAQEYPFYTNGYIVYRKDEPEDSNVMKWVNSVLSKRGSEIILNAGYVPYN